MGAGSKEKAKGPCCHCCGCKEGRGMVYLVHHPAAVAPPAMALLKVARKLGPGQERENRGDRLPSSSH